MPQLLRETARSLASKELYLKGERQRNEEIKQIIDEEPITFSLATSPILNEQSTASSSAAPLQMNESLPVTEKMYAKLLENNRKLHKEIEIMKRKLNSQRKQLLYYKIKSKGGKSLSKVEAVNILKKVLTENQISILLKKKKRVNWTTDEIAVAFTIRYFSKKCYIFLRSKLNFPLPALSTLRSWASKITIKPGILKDVLIFLKVAGENMSPREKTLVISFDEVKVKSTLEYDVREDQVLGHFNLMQVCMVRSMFSTWKQPIYIGFDQKMTRGILVDIITQLHYISYNCVAIVSDCGGSNVGLWRDLSVDINKTYFNHPQTQKNIYVFADAPHLLKLLRNWLLDTGFNLRGDETIKIRKEPLECLIKLTNTEVNSCYKISDKHITVIQRRLYYVTNLALIRNSLKTWGSS